MSDRYVTEAMLLDTYALSGSCCQSCIEDDELGYSPMPFVEYQGQEVSVCCKHVTQLREALAAASGSPTGEKKDV